MQVVKQPTVLPGAGYEVHSAKGLTKKECAELLQKIADEELASDELYSLWAYKAVADNYTTVEPCGL